MKKIIINLLIFVVALVLGSILNGLLINLGPKLIAAPKGADITTMEGLKATMHLFKPINFLFPFLAHALGTLLGAFLVSKFCSVNQFQWALAVGIMFFIGGAINVYMLPSPLWYSITDLVLAYIPMAF